MTTGKEHDPAAAAEDWLPELCRSAGVSQDSPLLLIAQRMDDLATKVAPVARTWWKWLILIQGLSVLAPLLWLVRKPLNLPPPTAALFTLAAAVILVSALWWVRWRGMQRTWARARLVAEVARGRLAAAVCPQSLSLGALDAVPAVRNLPAPPAPAVQPPWPQWKDAWVADRVETQLRFFREKKAAADLTRQRFSRWTTLFMDVALALAVAGVVVTLSRRAPTWLRLLGDYRLELAMGLAGTGLTLGIMLLQAVRHFQELNRRTAGFARQITMLESARGQLDRASSPEVALQIVAATEDKLLTEVVDWYYETENAEEFFQVRDAAQRSHAAPLRSAPMAPGLRVVAWILAVGGMSLLFACRVILGRLPWIAITSAVTLGWLSFNTPTDAEARSRLRPDASLLDVRGQPWQPTRDRAELGCIIIAHGLHDGATLTNPGETAWMRELSEAIETRLGDRTPNIGLVDWAAAAAPTQVHGIDPKIAAAKFAADVAGIQPQAHEVGDLLAFRLGQWIREKKIRRDRPLHFIGHSAGGFAVARAALVLHETNLAPSEVQVTILDTPAPDNELLVELPKHCNVDFYITSGFVVGLQEKDASTGLRIQRVPCDPSFGLLQAHSFAHAWFTKSIPTAMRNDAGFGRSPFCPAN